MVLPVRSPKPPAPVARPRLINRAFALLWGGQTISVLGSHITGSGIPLIAILLLKASPAEVGLLIALSAVPNLIFSLPIGVWIDRLPRRRLLIMTDLLRALLLLSLPIASLIGYLHMGQLYLVTLLLSTCTIGFDTAYQAFLPQIVASDQLVEGNSKLGTSASLAEMGGPPLAGVLIQTIGAPLAVLFDALSFLVSSASIWLIRPHEIQKIESIEDRSSFWREIHEGLRALSVQPLLRTLAIFTTLSTFFGGSFAALYTLYIVQELRIVPAFYGILVALGGLGALIGSLILPRITRHYGVKRVLGFGALLHGLLTLLTPLASGGTLLVLGTLGLSQLLGDIGFQLFALNELSLRQGLVDDHVQGRVNSVMGFLVGGIAPLGSLLAGVLSEYIGIRMTLFCGSVGMLLSAVWLLLVLTRRPK
ncbi:MAG TPA: MFS transporter [Ktedonobacteraceae bacterium]|nr:MFS transporter [Ktedonobacteraceae bacterium]